MVGNEPSTEYVRGYKQGHAECKAMFESHEKELNKLIQRVIDTDDRTVSAEWLMEARAILHGEP